ncbi:MAG TPA: ferrochelatase [Gammaproteobacteria bacterium]
MPNSHDSTTFKHDQSPVVGILITNLGTPDAPDASALRRYLKEFLWDPRIVDMPRALWWFILQVILLIRPAKSAKSYQKIWDLKTGSPLLAISRRQADALRAALQAKRNGPIVLELGMRYGNPSIASALEKLRQANAQRILVLPLYPQYSSSTTASTFDAAAAAVKSWRWVPELRFVNQYHDDADYIAALTNSVEEAWSQHAKPKKLLFSFHGTPKRFLLTGDPYFCQCQKTARLVAEKLQLKETEWQVVFQSIFGREEWLKPYAIETLRELGRQGVDSVDVVCPGFSADCLETLEEIEMENRHAYLEAGGEQYHYIPALNDRADHINALLTLIQRHCQGWDTETVEREDDAKRRWERAQQLGAGQ